MGGNRCACQETRLPKVRREAIRTPAPLSSTIAAGNLPAHSIQLEPLPPSPCLLQPPFRAEGSPVGAVAHGFLCFVCHERDALLHFPSAAQRRVQPHHAEGLLALCLDQLVALREPVL